MPCAFKAFCFLLIIFNVDLVCPVENCVKLRWNNTFNFSFYPNDGSSFMQSRVRNFIRYCLENLTGETLRSCKKPAVEGNFPLISGAPNISLEMLHRPVLATKEASAGTAVQIFHAFEEIWQLFVLCLLAAILSGILIWFFVSIFKVYNCMPFFNSLYLEMFHAPCLDRNVILLCRCFCSIAGNVT